MKKKIKNGLFLIPLVIISIISIIPFYFIISMATHSTTEIYNVQLFTFGNKLLENIKTIISGGFLKYYWNTIFSSVLSGVVCVLVSSMAAYALTVYKFKLRNSIKTLIITSMMIPGQISLLGYTIEMRSLHLVNTHWPLILTWVSSAYGVFFIIQYMRSSLPIELVESARIDGCGEFRTFISVGLPMIKAGVGTLHRKESKMYQKLDLTSIGRNRFIRWEMTLREGAKREKKSLLRIII